MRHTRAEQSQPVTTQRQINTGPTLGIGLQPQLETLPDTAGTYGFRQHCLDTETVHEIAEQLQLCRGIREAHDADFHGVGGAIAG